MRKLVLLIAGSVLLFTGCGETDEQDGRGLRYFPDMYSSPVLESQEAFVVPAVYDENGVQVTPAREIPVMLTPPEGSVPRDFTPYDLADDIYGLVASKELVNPLSPTADVLKLGREKYDIYCAVCHGKDGNHNNGNVVGKVQGILSINTGNVNVKPDGEIYHIITNGRGRMPHYKAQLLPEDRWAVVHYVRAIYRATKGDKSELEQLEDAGASDEFAPARPAVPAYERRAWPDDKVQKEGEE